MRRLRTVLGFVAGPMLAFGCIVLLTFADLVKGRAVSLRPAVIIAVGYLAFGIYALAIAGEASFLFTFLLPGILLLVAASGWARTG